MFPFTQPTTRTQVNTIPEALTQLALGRPIIVVDSEDRENEGDIVFAAEFATPGILAFTVRHSSGIVCVAMTDSECQRLNLPQMCSNNQHPKQTAFTVSVDASAVESTGISATDRARTITELASPRSTPEDFTRPGHVFPLRAVAGGALIRAGHTEAAVDLVRLAGLRPVAAIAEIVNDDGSVARRPELMLFAATHSLVIVTIRDLIAYRFANETHVHREPTPEVDLPAGHFTTVGYRSDISPQHFVALIHKGPRNLTPPIVRVRPECVHGQLFGAPVCACNEQLAADVNDIAQAGAGVLICVSDARTQQGGLLDRLPKIHAAQPLSADPSFVNDQITAALVADVLQDLGVPTATTQPTGLKIAIMSKSETRWTDLVKAG